jgi:CRP-like cAMP-binding protein
MSPLASVHREPPGRSPHTAVVGEALYRLGEDGSAWRLARGVIRLDTRTLSGESCFASLAIAGDIIGCETLLFGAYTFDATALTECELLPWPEGSSAPSSDSLLASLAAAQRRAAEVVALRGGQAVDRLLALVRLLADDAGRVVLPMRQDIADITALRFETISRLVKRLEQAVALRPIRLEGVHATRSFQVDPACLA